MFNQRFDSQSKQKFMFGWYLLTFNAGCINAGGFLATGRFVSHVTGFASLFGVDLVKHENEAALGILSVPVFFLLGAFISGMLVDRPIYQKRHPHYDYAMGLSSVCLFLTAIGGGHLQFVNVGLMLHLKEVYVSLALLCMACGLQNGAISASSKGTIRTTHLTGLTTDLGLGFARLLTYQKGQPNYSEERHANWLRGSSILAFVLGSGVGAWLFIKLGHRGFIVSGLVSLYGAYHGRRIKKAIQV
jgi:uncharacterized membrane protein YoaK (UPF0700 family)